MIEGSEFVGEKRKIKRSDVTRNMILREARRLLREVGRKNTTLKAIAEGIGVKPPSLYNYYPSKRALLAAAESESSSPSSGDAESAV